MTDKTILKGSMLLKDTFSASVGDVNKLVLKMPNTTSTTTITFQQLRIYFNADFSSTRASGASDNDEDTTIFMTIGSTAINQNLKTGFTPVSLQHMEFTYGGETYVIMKYVGNEDVKMINSSWSHGSLGVNADGLEVWVKSGAVFCLRKSTDVIASPSTGEIVAYACTLTPTIASFAASSTSFDLEDPFITDPHDIVTSNSPTNSHLTFADSTGQPIITITHSTKDYQNIFNTGESQFEPILDINADTRFRYIESIDSATTPPTINHSNVTVTEMVKENENQNTRLQAVEAKVGFPVGSVYQFASTGVPTLPDAIAALGTWLEISYITYTVSGTSYNVKTWTRTA